MAFDVDIQRSKTDIANESGVSSRARELIQNVEARSDDTFTQSTTTESFSSGLSSHGFNVSKSGIDDGLVGDVATEIQKGMTDDIGTTAKGFGLASVTNGSKELMSTSLERAIVDDLNEASCDVEADEDILALGKKRAGAAVKPKAVGKWATYGAKAIRESAAIHSVHSTPVNHLIRNTRKEIAAASTKSAMPTLSAQATSTAKATLSKGAEAVATKSGGGGIAAALGGVSGVVAPVIAIVLVVAIVAGAVSSMFSSGGANLPEEVEAWRADVDIACIEVFGDTTWSNVILAMMAAESGGNINVSSVVSGVRCDIMQAAEGAYGNVIKHGATQGIGIYGSSGNVVGPWEYSTVSPNTPQASIYAGVLEFKMNLELWESWLGPISPWDTGKIGLIVQGYNYGANGWFKWCKRNNVTTYTLEDSKRYQTTLPAGLKGTANHAEKVLAYLEAPVFTGGSAAVARAYEEIGKPYVWGAGGPGSFDCSGLVSYCITGEYGRVLGTTYTMDPYQPNSRFTLVSSPQPGDICWRREHVGLYIGDGKMIHAPRPGAYVCITTVPSNMVYARFKG